jgi:predicted site-specific integrase-resolvase
LDILQSERPVQKLEKTPEKRIVYGLKGIAEIFGCSTSTAQRIKNSGKIKKAITQVGRKIVVDADLALELFKK